MSKKTKIIISSILAFLIIATTLASGYFFKVAEVRDNSNPVQNLAKDHPLYHEYTSFINANKQNWSIQSDDDLTLKAWYLPAEKATNKTVILVHGFRSNKDRMAQYGWMFHEQGYNVLLPDNRAHGDSEGELIGYGWLDRLDSIKWINEIIKKNGQNSEIAMFGLSMGAATVMMTSGEKLPDNVKLFIEDCGYNNVFDETAYQAKQMYNLPAFPLVYMVSGISKVLAGYSYTEASSVNQLKKNTRPMLFIHGEADDYVPTSMVYENYNATKGPKEMLIVPNAKHAQSYDTDKELYEKTVSAFMHKYFK
jgi:fermentation-respiration switch protein FrsA (DUF1100 family)